MTRNNLFIERLVVFSMSGSLAYDEEFHKGVNIIRGDNSSGKSTITNFIFFILGGDFNDFVPEAKRCSEVFAQVRMNDATMTIRRTIDLDDSGKVKSRIPMYFFWGKYDESRNPPPDKNWQKFGYNSYPEAKSFSNVIFDNLNIPTVKGDSNITIHQLLRLMYIDQDSPTSSLFYYEQFDSQITRETTAELLLGIYNDELYQNRRRLQELVKEIDEIKSEIKATKGFFSDSTLLNPGHVESMISNAQQQLKNIEGQIAELKTTTEGVNTQIDDFKYQQLSNEIIVQRSLVTRIQQKINTIDYEIADNEYFIASLNDKLKALKNSLVTREFLSSFPLLYCPDCLTEIKEPDRIGPTESTCRLCKETVDTTFGKTQGRRMEQEISFQIIESTAIQKRLKQEIGVLQPTLDKEMGKLDDLQKRFDEEIVDVKTSKQEQIENLYVQKGLTDGEILQYRTMLENANYYSGLLKRRDELMRERDTIDAFIFKTETGQNILREKIELQTKQEALYLLNNDLHRQDEFKNANDFHIDYSNNIAFLDSKYSKYSASSNFYLKITARFAIFLASLKIPEMRYPRFILADNMEDKGIEERRAQNFQKILIERLKSFSTNDYQVIYTTSYITEALNNSDLVVGEYYTTINRTLKNV
ncbi:MAG: hypothetical protein EOP56_19295 [Sphingobacteriales bacterium]|nr:MAG: hypothetical protein EOP56_19295 [Sphingobacteriales bacterium]